MTTTTPGPWVCLGRFGAGYYIGGGPKATPIAVVYGDNQNLNGAANAELIAAAPQLRDALKTLLPHVKVTKATRIAIVNAAFALKKAGGAIE